MLMVPIFQSAAFVLVSAISMLWHRFGGGRKNQVLSLLNLASAVAFLIYVPVSMLQHLDAKTIDTANEVNFFIRRHCEAHGGLPTSGQVHARFPGLTTDAGWFFFSNDANWMKMQYPVRWSNSRAIGKSQVSEFTATTYSYIVEYRCGGTG